MGAIQILKGFATGDIFYESVAVKNSTSHINQDGRITSSAEVKTVKKTDTLSLLTLLNPLTWPLRIAAALTKKFSTSTKAFKRAFYVANLPIIAIGLLVVAPFAAGEFAWQKRPKKTTAPTGVAGAPAQPSTSQTPAPISKPRYKDIEVSEEDARKIAEAIKATTEAYEEESKRYKEEEAQKEEVKKAAQLEQEKTEAGEWLQKAQGISTKASEKVGDQKICQVSEAQKTIYDQYYGKGFSDELNQVDAKPIYEMIALFDALVGEGGWHKIPRKKEKEKPYDIADLPRFIKKEKLYELTDAKKQILCKRLNESPLITSIRRREDANKKTQTILDCSVPNKNNSTQKSATIWSAESGKVSLTITIPGTFQNPVSDPTLYTFKTTQREKDSAYAKAKDNFLLKGILDLSNKTLVTTRRHFHMEKSTLGKPLTSHAFITDMDTLINANISFLDEIIDLKSRGFAHRDCDRDNILCDAKGQLHFIDPNTTSDPDAIERDTDGKYFVLGAIQKQYNDAHRLDDELEYGLTDAQMGAFDAETKTLLQAESDKERKRQIRQDRDQQKAALETQALAKHHKSTPEYSPYAEGLFDKSLLTKKPFSQHVKKISDMNEMLGAINLLLTNETLGFSININHFLIALNNSPFLRLETEHKAFLQEVTQLLDEVKKAWTDAGGKESHSAPLPYPNRAELARYIVALHTKELFPNEWKKHVETHPNPLTDEARKELLVIEKPKSAPKLS